MTTLAELNVQIQANTQGLQQAIPALQNVANSVGQLSRSVEQMSRQFQQQMGRMGQSAQAQASAVSQSSKTTQDAMKRQEAALMGARRRMEEFRRSVKEAGASPLLLGNVTKSFNNLNKVMKDSSSTAGDVALAKARYQDQLAKARNQLRTFTSAQRQANATQQQTERASIKQINAIERTRIKYLDLVDALRAQGADPAQIESLTNSFNQFESRLKSGTLTSREFAEEQNRINSAIASAKRQEGLTDFNRRMTDLSKSVQIALGPLSGVAARITAFASLANRTTIAIAGLTGAFIAFGTALGKSMVIGARFERDMLRIESAIANVGDRFDMTADQVDDAAKRVAEATLTSRSLARQAASNLIVSAPLGFPEERLDQALTAAQGLSLSGRGDIQTNIRRVIRLFNNLDGNLKELTESGVHFNAVERRMINNLAEQGKTAEAIAAVFETRLNKVVAQAESEAQQLSGAWDTLVETITGFAEEAVTTSGALDNLTQFLRDITMTLKDTNDEYEVSSNVGWSFAKTIQGITAAINFLINHLQEITVLLAGLGILKAIGLFGKLTKALLGAVGATQALSGALTFFANLHPVIRALTLAVTAGAVAFSYFSRQQTAAQEAASKHAKTMREVDQMIAKVGTGIDGQIQKYRKLRDAQLKAAQQEVERAQEALTEFRERMEEGVIDLGTWLGIGEGKEQKLINDLAAALDHLKQVRDDFAEKDRQIESATGLSPDVSEAEEKAANIVKELADEHLDLNREMNKSANAMIALEDSLRAVIEEETGLSTETMTLTQAINRLGDDALQNVFKGAGVTKEELKVLARTVDELGDSVARQIRQLETQAIVAKEDIAIAQAQGAQKHELSREQRVLNELMSAFPNHTREQIAALEDLTPKELEYAEAIRKTTEAIHDRERQTRQIEMAKEIENRIQLLEAEIGLWNAGEATATRALARIRLEQQMLNAGIERGDKAWKRMLALLARAEDLEIHKQHRESVKALQDQIHLQRVNADTMFFSERTQKRMVALEEKRLELRRKYGEQNQELIQQELKLFKQLQDQQKLLEGLEVLKEGFDSVFKHAEDALVDFFMGAEQSFSDFMRAIAADFIRIGVREFIMNQARDALGSMMQGLFPGISGDASTGPAELGSSVHNPMYVTIVGATGGLARTFEEQGQEAAKSFERIAQAGLPVELTPESQNRFDRTFEMFEGQPSAVPTIDWSPILDAQTGGFNDVVKSVEGLPASWNKIQTQVFRDFSAAGFDTHQIAGIMGNIQRESGFDPTAFNANEHAVGLFQHSKVFSPDRFARLEQTAANMGTDIWDPSAQIQTAIQEMRGAEARAGGMITGATDVRGATIGATAFERPAGFSWADPTQTHDFGQRLGFAEQFNQQMEQASLSAEQFSLELDNLQQGVPSTTTSIESLEAKMDALSQSASGAENSFKSLGDNALTKTAQTTAETSAATQTMGSSANEASNALRNLSSSAQGASQGASGVGEQASQSIVSPDAASGTEGQSQGMFSGITGMFQNLFQNLGQILQQFMSMIPNLLGSLGGLVGGGGGMGGIGSLLGMFGLFHQGGVVGASAVPMRAAALGPAVKLHDGLATDEFRAILKKNEVVLNEEQQQGLIDSFGLRGGDDGPRRGGGGARPVINVYTPDADSFKRSEVSIGRKFIKEMERGNKGE